MQEFYDEVFQLQEYHDGIYSVTSSVWAPPGQPGGAIMQSWVVEGQDKVMVMDSPVPELPGFRAFLKGTFHKELMMVLTHGHIDHTGCNGQFEKVWMHLGDYSLLLGGGIKPLEEQRIEQAVRPNYEVAFLQEGELIDLGERKLRVLWLGGHTPGSIGLYDERTAALFSGDAVARRLLYGLSGWTPLSTYFMALKNLERYSIREIYSMHDAFCLPADQPTRIIHNILEGLPTTEATWEMPDTGEQFLMIQQQEDESDMEYFNFVMPVEKRQEAIEDLTTHGYYQH